MGECRYIDDCRNMCSSCKNSMALSKCIIGLNRALGDDTSEIVRLNMEIEKLKKELNKKKEK